MPPARSWFVALVAAAALTACSGTAPSTARAAAFAPAPVAAAAAATPPPPPSPIPAADRQTIKLMLYNAAVRQGVNPGLVMAVAWWESSWNQSAISPTGAIGIMQIEPDVAAYAAPALLGRPADPHVLADNIDLGTAILKEDLDHYGNDLIKALVAYNSGGDAVTDWSKLDPGHQTYVLGIYNLAIQFDEGKGPA